MRAKRRWSRKYRILKERFFPLNIWLACLTTTYSVSMGIPVNQPTSLKTIRLVVLKLFGIFCNICIWILLKLTAWKLLFVPYKEQKSIHVNIYEFVQKYIVLFFSRYESNIILVIVICLQTEDWVATSLLYSSVIFLVNSQITARNWSFGSIFTLIGYVVIILTFFT